MHTVVINLQLFCNIKHVCVDVKEGPKDHIIMLQQHHCMLCTLVPVASAPRSAQQHKYLALSQAQGRLHTGVCLDTATAF